MLALHGCPWTFPGDLFFIIPSFRDATWRFEWTNPWFRWQLKEKSNFPNTNRYYSFSFISFLSARTLHSVFVQGPVCLTQGNSTLTAEQCRHHWITYVSILTAFKFRWKVPVKSWKYQQREDGVASLHWHRWYSAWWNVLLWWICPQAWRCWRKYHLSQSIK